MSDDAITYRKRQRQYERRVDMLTWVGATLAGLIAISTSSAFDSAAPAWLKAVEITLILVCAGFFGRARVNFEWEATRIKRKIEDGEATAEATLAPDMMAWPSEAEESWTLSLSTLIIAGFVMALCFWWPVISGIWSTPPATPKDPQSQPQGK
jgi:ABC-type phosphate/phosphonate transport system permease subunit